MSSSSPSSPVIYPLPGGTPGSLRRALGGGALQVGVEGSGGKRVYLDTFDQRLLRRGEVLAFGPDADTTALRWETVDGGLLRRLSLPRPPTFVVDLPEGAFREALEAILDVRRLLPLARVQIDGERLVLRNRDRKIVARLTLERWTQPGRRKTTGPWLRFLPLRGYAKPAAKALSLVQAKLDLVPARPEGALGLLGVTAPWIEPPPRAGPVPLEADLRADQAFKRVLASQLDVMRLNEAGTAKALDPEFLHDYRVAIRRTRAALSSAKGILPAPRVAHFKTAFRWLGDVTNAPRDLDVHLLRCPSYEAALGPSSRPHLRPLVAHLKARRLAVQKPLVRALASARYKKLLASWQAFLDAPPAARTRLPRAAKPAIDVASELIAKRHRRLLEHGLAIDATSPAAALHEVRLDGKKLRYLLEFFRDLYDDGALRTHLKAMKRLQDCLGDFNDFEVQQAALQHAAEEMVEASAAPPATLVAVGQLVESLAAGQRRERERFLAVFGAFAVEKNRARARALFGPSAEPRA